MLTNKVPDIQRLHGLSDGIGQMMGLDNRLASNIIKLVGNVADMWEYTITLLGVPQGSTALWTKGGLMDAPPIR